MKGRKREIAGRKCPNDSECLLKIRPHALKIVCGVKKIFRGVKKIFQRVWKIFHTLQKIFYTPQKIFVTQQRIFLSIFFKSDFQLAITFGHFLLAISLILPSFFYPQDSAPNYSSKYVVLQPVFRM